MQSAQRCFEKKSRIVVKMVVSELLFQFVRLQDQYVFWHQAVMEALVCGNTEVAAQDLMIRMNKLTRVNKSTKQTGYAEEFKVTDNH